MLILASLTIAGIGLLVGGHSASLTTLSKKFRLDANAFDEQHDHVRASFFRDSVKLEQRASLYGSIAVGFIIVGIVAALWFGSEAIWG